MSICQAENGFYLDELVKKVADACKKKIFSDILKMNLQLTQVVLMYRIFNGKSNLQCCSDGHSTMNNRKLIKKHSVTEKRTVFYAIKRQISLTVFREIFRIYGEWRGNRLFQAVHTLRTMPVEKQNKLRCNRTGRRTVWKNNRAKSIP